MRKMIMRFTRQRFSQRGLLLIALVGIGGSAVVRRAAAQEPAADKLLYPAGIATRGERDIFVADLEAHGIWKIEGKAARMYFQGKKQFRTPLNRPRALAIDGEGHLLAGCSSTREVYRFDGNDQPVSLAAGGIGNPMGIAVNNDGDLLVSDQELQCIWKVPAAGGKAAKWVEVPAPRGICLDGEERLWVVSGREDKGSLVRVLPTKEIEIIVKGREFKFPLNVAVDKDGVAYVSDGYAATVWKIEAGGKPVAWAKGDPLKSPTGLAWQGATLLVSDPQVPAIFQIGADGKPKALELEFTAP